MQKYKSNLTSVSGAAVRGASITVLDESGANASIFLDRAGTLPAGNPLKTAQDGTFEFYAANGRYSLRTDSSGLNVLEEDVILMFDPDDATVSGPIADAIQDAKDSAAQAQSSADQAQLAADQAQLAADQAQDAADLAKQETDQLKNDLESQEGADSIGFIQSGAGAVYRTVQEKSREKISPLDFNAKGNGSTNDTAAFSIIEADFTGVEVDLCGKTYLVDTIPNRNIYFNGLFKVGSNIYITKNVRAMDRNGIVSIGDAAQSIPDGYVMPYNQFSYSNAMFAAGSGAMASVTKGKQSVAIGPNSQGNSLITFDNISIGEVSLQNVQSESDQYSPTQDAGTRNIGIGGNSLQFLTTGRRNIGIGRNAATGMVLGSNTVAVGASALFGFNVNGWHPYVENYIPNTNTNTALVAVGYSAGMVYNGTAVTFVGYQSGMNMKTGDANTFVGDKTGRDMEIGNGWLGYTRTDFGPATVPYTKTGNNVVVTLAGHNAVVGGRAHIYWRNDGPAYANHNHAFPVVVTAVAGDTFTVQCPYAGDGSGTADVYWTTSLTAATQSRHNTVVGHNAAMTTPQSNNSVVIGSLAAQNAAVTLSNATIVGMNSMRSVTQTATGTTTLGYNTLAQNTSGITNTTAVGYQAGLVMQDGSAPSVSVNNSTMLGAASAVSGANQVQLGSSSTTTYVYGTVQNRSDLRDKADVRDTMLGLDFIRSLRPVDFLWDMREDYIDVLEDGQVVRHPKDGSRKRLRFHHGFVAQEVEALIQSTGIDFGGFQDHKVKGGCDVLSIGYDEFIAPIVKSIQELEARILSLEKKMENDGA